MLAVRDEPHQPAPPAAFDPSFKRLVMYVFAGTKGGYNRIKIIKLLRDEPMNANRVSERLGLDYKTVQHHIRLLEANNMVTSSPKGSYAAILFVTQYMERHMSLVDEMRARFGRT